MAKKSPRQNQNSAENARTSNNRSIDDDLTIAVNRINGWHYVFLFASIVLLPAFAWVCYEITSQGKKLATIEDLPATAKELSTEVGNLKTAIGKVEDVPSKVDAVQQAVLVASTKLDSIDNISTSIESLATKVEKLETQIDVAATNAETATKASATLEARIVALSKLVVERQEFSQSFVQIRVELRPNSARIVGKEVVFDFAETAEIIGGLKRRVLAVHSILLELGGDGKPEFPAFAVQGEIDDKYTLRIGILSNNPEGIIAAIGKSKIFADVVVATTSAE